MGTSIKPIGIIQEMLAGIGCHLSTAHEDMLFFEQNTFMLRTDENGEDVRLYFNTESSAEKRNDIVNLLKECGRQYRFIVDRKGTFSFSTPPHQGHARLQVVEGS